MVYKRRREVESDDGMDSDEREALAAFNDEGFDDTIQQEEAKRAKEVEDEVEAEKRKAEEKVKKAAEENTKRHREERIRLEKEAVALAIEDEKAAKREAAEETRRAEKMSKPVHFSKDFREDKKEDEDMYEKYKQSKLVPVGAKEGRFESGDQRIPFDASMIPSKPF